jgi:hypothetical protein
MHGLGCHLGPAKIRHHFRHPLMVQHGAVTARDGLSRRYQFFCCAMDVICHLGVTRQRNGEERITELKVQSMQRCAATSKRRARHENPAYTATSVSEV